MKKRTTEEFIYLSKKLYGENKYDYSKTEYITKDTKVCIICKKCKLEFWQSPNHHLQGHEGCKSCNKERWSAQQRKSLDQFINEARHIHKDKYGYSQVRYINNNEKVLIHCNKCGTDFYQSPAHHLKGHGCKKCQDNKRRQPRDIFIKKAKKIHKNQYIYDKVEYKNNHTKVKIYCKKCQNYFMQLPFQHTNNKQGCPYCTRIKSKGEEYIAKWLSNKNILFIREKRFKDCRDKNPLPFDFYLPDYNLCIEFQGQQHYRNSFYIAMKKSKEKGLNLYNKMQLHDKIKKEYCLQNNINFLEIKYNENIEDILKANFY